MDSLPAFVAGVVVGLVLAGLLAWARRGSVTDLGGSASGTPMAAAPPAFEEPSLGLGPGAMSIVHRVAARLEPDGRLTIQADGEAYSRLEDVPDPATREQVRTILASLPAQMKDPVQRDRVESELRAAGIEASDTAHAQPDPGATPPRA